MAKDEFRLFLELMYPVAHGEYPECKKEAMVKALDYAKEYQVSIVFKHIELMLCFYYLKLGSQFYTYARPATYTKDLLADWKMSEEQGLLKFRKVVYNLILDARKIEEEPAFIALDGDTVEISCWFDKEGHKIEWLCWKFCQIR